MRVSACAFSCTSVVPINHAQAGLQEDKGDTVRAKQSKLFQLSPPWKQEQLQPSSRQPLSGPPQTREQCRHPKSVSGFVLVCYTALPWHYITDTEGWCLKTKWRQLHAWRQRRWGRGRRRPTGRPLSPLHKGKYTWSSLRPSSPRPKR